MKQLFVLVIISLSLHSFGQTNMFWNNYSNSNPAMSGFEYTQHSSLTARESANWNKGIDIFQANYNQRISGKHGVGITLNGFYHYFSSHSALVNYNYQFDLKKAGKLSAGAGIGAGHTRLRDKYSYILEPGQEFAPQNNFILTLGVAYSWKKLLLGVNTSDLTVANLDYIDPPEYRAIAWNSYASYDFQISNNFQLSPRLNFRIPNSGKGQITSNLTVTFRDKFAAGISYFPNAQWGLNLGWDISNKFRVAYMISQRFNLHPSIDPSQYRTHEFSIGYILKNKRVICGFRLEPETEP